MILSAKPQAENVIKDLTTFSLYNSSALMLPTLSQVYTLHSPFDSELEDYSAGHCRSVEIWLTKLEDFLKTHSLDDVRKILERLEVKTPVASYQGGLLATQEDARREHWQHFTKRLELCRELEIQTLVVACDLQNDLSQQDLERVQVSLVEAATTAAKSNVRIALEFQSDAKMINNLQSAASLLAQLGQPNLGLCFDLFHYYCGPSKFEDLGYLTTENLFHVQLSDISGIPRELARDSDRILPGDGDFSIEPIIEHLKAINYTGPVSIELMNHQIWHVGSRNFGEIAMTALRKILGQASMG